MKKIVNEIAELNRFLEAHREKRVVFTNGVFDLLHPGHIDLLTFARSQGDLLIVGINDDASVRRLKGDKRPIFPLKARLEVLAALEMVDFVVSFSQNTPLELIKNISRIDVLVKGGDYTLDAIVGRKEVEAAGGKVIAYSFNHRYSTTNLVKKILRYFK